MFSQIVTLSFSKNALELFYSSSSKTVGHIPWERDEYMKGLYWHVWALAHLGTQYLRVHRSYKTFETISNNLK
jgi:hypothetical protein